MKKARWYMLFALISILSVFVLYGCNEQNDKVASISLKDNDPNTAIEIASGEFDFNDYTVVVVYESGSREEIALTEEMIAGSDLLKTYQVGDHEITVKYGGQEYTFKVSVKRSVFGAISFPENNVFTYDGAAHTVEVEGELPANAVVTYLGANSFVNAGTYDVTAVVSCDGYATQKLSTTVKIERAKYDLSGVKFEGKEVVYDGNPHSLTVSGTLPDGVSTPRYTINEKTTSSATDVGEYTVKASFSNNDPNYEPIPTMEAILKITPAEFAVNGVDILFRNADGDIINDNTKLYDGSSVTFDLDDYNKLSKKLSVSFSVCDEDGNIISSSNQKTGILNVGVYTVKAEFTHADDKNYKPIAPIIRIFEVMKSNYPSLGDIQLRSMQISYDGKEHSLAVAGQIPDGVTVSYEYYLGGTLIVDEEGNPAQTVIDSGRYTVKAVFVHSNENYNRIPVISATLNVVKIKVDTTMMKLSGTPTVEYSGAPHKIEFLRWQEINGKDYDVLQYGTVKYYKFDGEANKYVELAENELPTEVGSYIATIVLTVSEEYERNYCFGDGSQICTLTANLEIKKKSITIPDVSFESEDTFVYTGEANQIEYSGAVNSESVTFSNAYFEYNYGLGKYVLLENGAPIDVGSYKLVVTATICNAAQHVFSNGDSKKEFTFEFDVVPKTIDVSGITLNRSEAIYNEADQSPTLQGVPPHVNAVLRFYSGSTMMPVDSVINAGEYRCEVILEAESSNYALSSDRPFSFDYVILPMVINVDNITFEELSFSYDGNPHLPEIKDLDHVQMKGNLYSVYLIGDEIHVEEAVKAGKYRYDYWLVPESPNYVLSGQTRELSVDFEIKTGGIVLADIDVLLNQTDFYIELPYGDGLYKYTEDDSVHINAILNAIFGENSSFVTCIVNAPKDPETGAYLHEMIEGANTIEEGKIYMLECRFAVTDTNQYNFYHNNRYVQEDSVTFKVKFIENNA